MSLYPPSSIFPISASVLIWTFMLPMSNIFSQNGAVWVSVMVIAQNNNQLAVTRPHNFFLFVLPQKFSSSFCLNIWQNWQRWQNTALWPDLHFLETKTASCPNFAGISKHWPCCCWVITTSPNHFQHGIHQLIASVLKSTVLTKK